MIGHAFPLVEVSGSSYEMGYQHGAQAAALVRQYLMWIDRLTGKPRDQTARSAMAFLPLLQALDPRLVEEVRGLAAGAGISMEEAMLCQCRVEAALIGQDGCTAFALRDSATADGQTLAGQNQDLATEYADVAVLLRVKPNDGRPRALLFTFAGQIGYSGMNEYGLAHFNNALYDFTRQMALPHYPIKRAMLQQRTVAECVDLLAKHHGSHAVNVVMCDGQGDIGDVEARPEATAVFEDDHPDWIIHTNHYVTREFAAYDKRQSVDSHSRLARMRALVKENWGRITVDTLKSILADHQSEGAGICRHGESGSHSISGYIAEPAKGLLHVRRGHGCLGTWQAYDV